MYSVTHLCSFKKRCGHSKLDITRYVLAIFNLVLNNFLSIISVLGSIPLDIE